MMLYCINNFWRCYIFFWRCYWSVVKTPGGMRNGNLPGSEIVNWHFNTHLLVLSNRGKPVEFIEFLHLIQIKSVNLGLWLWVWKSGSFERKVVESPTVSVHLARWEHGNVEERYCEKYMLSFCVFYFKYSVQYSLLHAHTNNHSISVGSLKCTFFQV